MKWLLSIIVCLSFTLSASEKVLQVPLEGKMIYQGRTANAPVVATGKFADGVLELKFEKNAELRIDFPKPTLDITPYTHLTFQVKYTHSSAQGYLMLRCLPNWAQSGYRLNSVTENKGGGAGEGLRLPANEWINISIPLDKVPKIFHKDQICQIATGWSPGKGVTDTPQIIQIKDMKFIRKKQVVSEKMKQWDNYIKNYKPDYSDSSKFLQPPQKGRLSHSLPLVKNGIANAEIIYMKAEEPDCVATAANDLQYWIEKITGAKLPVITKAWKSANKSVKIFLGKRSRQIAHDNKLFADDLAVLSGSDGYAIRPVGDAIYIFGAEGKGTMNGVYAFLENNTDIIFPRPSADDSDIAVYSQVKDLNAVWGDHMENPASRGRGYGMGTTAKWMARNYCNYFAGGGGGDISEYNQEKRRYGNFLVCHMFSHIISAVYLPPQKYFKDKPEFYSLVNGKRKLWAQLCFTNENMIKEYEKNVLDLLRRAPDESECIYISLDDTWEACECKRCLAPIRGVSGKNLTKKDENFRSTQYFIFLNRIAEKVVKEFPKMQIRTLAYFSTAPVPDCDVHAAIRPEFAPYVRANDKRPIFAPENEYWLTRLQGWDKKSKNIDSYEYFGLGLEFPRPLAEVKAWDFREMLPYIKGMMSESRGGRRGKALEQWNKINDYSAIEYWLAMRLMWNPYQNVENLRKKYIARTFREAAPEMEKFYGRIREEWYKMDSYSTLGDRPVTLTKTVIIERGIESELRKYLIDGAQKVKHPEAAKLLAKVRERFEEYTAQAKAIKTPELSIPLIRPKGEVTFTSPEWNGAAAIRQLTQINKTPSAHQSTVKIFHDAQNVYFNFYFEDKFVKDLMTEKSRTAKEFFPRYDHLELFIGEPGNSSVYYLFAIDAQNNRCDMRMADSGWDGKWRSATKVTDKGWQIIVELPLTTIKGDIAKIDILKGTIIREYSTRANAPLEYSTWSGGKHHAIETFGSWKLMK